MWWIVFILPLVVNAQDDTCSDAPTEALKKVCRQMLMWDQEATAAAKEEEEALSPGVAFDGAQGGGGFIASAPPMADPVPSLPLNMFECLDLECVCEHLEGYYSNGACHLASGKAIRKAVRKEYRTLTDLERQKLHNAFRTIKDNGVYDDLAKLHKQVRRNKPAHSGPAFLPWHREFLKRMELALREADPEVSLPYWDSSLDSALDTPSDSVMFTQELFGETDASGNVINGDFAQWPTLTGRANLRRTPDRTVKELYTAENINKIMQHRNIENILTTFIKSVPYCHKRVSDDSNIEVTHGTVHMFVGGDMGQIRSSANDPIFYLHHCFVDYIWEQWRQRQQTRHQRENDYPNDLSGSTPPHHMEAAELSPFRPLSNRDGLSNKYTDNLYSYAPSPACTARNPSCGSRFLFCDQSHGAPRCSSKIRNGARCNGYRMGENPCYNGVCQNGVCVKTKETTTTAPVTKTTPAPSKKVTKQFTCFNENQCCETWAKRGECQKNKSYMSKNCAASCKLCTPHTPFYDNCEDRHHQCAAWTRRGECLKNELWMTENCRKSCMKCRFTRADECGARGKGHVTTTKPKLVCKNSSGCHNENICCAHWAARGDCTKNFEWMACNCRVSCGRCTPKTYVFGPCADYDKSCAGWTRRGECEKNPWMPENCRTSCKTCYTSTELSQKCNVPSGSIKPVTNAYERMHGINIGGRNTRRG